MDKVITATGKEFDSGYLVTIPNPPLLFVRIHNENMDAVREVFQNPEETATLTYADREYTGYTVFDSIINEGDALKVVLKHE